MCHYISKSNLIGPGSYYTVDDKYYPLLDSNGTTPVVSGPLFDNNLQRIL